MKNKSLTLLCVLVLGTTAPLVSFAESIDDKIDASANRIEVLQKEKNNAEAALAQIETEIAGITKQVDETLSKKNKLEEKLRDLHEEIRSLQQLIAQRSEKIDEQIRIMQIEEKSNRYVDAILEADNISDAITRTLAFTRLSSANNEIITEQRDDQKRLEEAQKDVETNIAEVNELTIQLKEQQNTMAEKQKEQVVLTAQVAASLNTEVSNKSRLVREKEAEEARRAEEARLAKIAAEKQKRDDAEAAKAVAKLVEQEKQNNKNNQQTNTPVSNPIVNNTPSIPASSGGGGGGSIVQTPTNTSGFQFPLSGGYTVTSGFGQRVDPNGVSGTGHDGIDLAGAAGSQILAARAGVVESAYYDPSGGNMIIIKHDNGYYTYYMHMSQTYPSAGQQVAAGQVIGAMGTTGNSTGVHLHFGIATGIWGGFLNPAPFIGL